MHTLAKYAQESIVVDKDLGAIQAACTAKRMSTCITDGWALFNSQVFIDSDGSLLEVQRKLQPIVAEQYVWAQGGGHLLPTWPISLGYNLGCLACWAHTINGARQVLIPQGQHIHAGAWPALSTMAGSEPVTDAQIESLVKAHALTGQVFVVTASNYVDGSCLNWMKEHLGEQDLVKAGGRWPSVLHPFCSYMAGPHTGAEVKLAKAVGGQSQLGWVKVWIDAAGHSQHPEILQFGLNFRPLWANEKRGISANPNAEG